ncbi:hypothetical protein T484DRAFT_1764231 [Baffinella frigidus]|nr:hypothetical protein T484DRAFT_1764231 [Cryptophyta sp. CCMP2293]
MARLGGFGKYDSALEKSSYSGNFTRGRRHGQGCLRGEDGSEYEGEWSEHAREGQGTQTYAGGDRYEGAWLQDQRSGTGSALWHR